MAAAMAVISTSHKLLTSSSTISLKFFSAISPSSPFSTFSKFKHKPKPNQNPKLQSHHKNSPSPSPSPSLSPAKSKTASKLKLESLKRRTRSDKEFDLDFVKKFGDKDSHIPVLLGEVLDVFSPSFSLRSFVDCTLGAAGHSSAVIQIHPEIKTYIGLDVDPIAHEKAQSRINHFLNNNSCSGSDLKAHILLKNFKEIKHIIAQIDEKLLTSGVNGILMDLGMSSMQVDDAGRGFSMLNNGPLDMRMNPMASLKAEDILNTWPETEVGRILKEYGEESNWYFLQSKIVKARQGGGLHSTSELVDLIRNTTCRTKGGRQGWIKTAARVFQALRIAVNDELKTLENALSSSFDCLSPGGRLAVISFHSLEDRIVKQTFLNLINSNQGEGKKADCSKRVQVEERVGLDNDNRVEEEGWIKQVVKGSTGVILTKRPITACAAEEKINPRCRSAKLRVIQKI